MQLDYDTDYSETRKLDRIIFTIVTLLIIAAALVAFEYNNIALAKRIISILGSAIVVFFAVVEFAYTV